MCGWVNEVVSVGYRFIKYTLVLRLGLCIQSYRRENITASFYDNDKPTLADRPPPSRCRFRHHRSQHLKFFVYYLSYLHIDRGFSADRPIADPHHIVFVESEALYVHTCTDM